MALSRSGKWPPGAASCCRVPKHSKLSAANSSTTAEKGPRVISRCSDREQVGMHTETCLRCLSFEPRSTESTGHRHSSLLVVSPVFELALVSPSQSGFLFIFTLWQFTAKLTRAKSAVILILGRYQSLLNCIIFLHVNAMHFDDTVCLLEEQGNCER